MAKNKVDPARIWREWLQPTLPYPLLKYEAAAIAKKIQAADKVPVYEGNINKSDDAHLIVDSQPKWRKAWLERNSQYLVHLVEAPKAIRDDLSFCPVPRMRSWKQQEILKRSHPTWLNYPKLPAPKQFEQPDRIYMVRTLTAAIKLFTGSPDFTCMMLRKICKTLLTVLEVFQPPEASESIFFFPQDTGYKCVYDLSTQLDSKIIHQLYQRIIFLPSYHMQAFEEAFYMGFFTIESEIFGPATSKHNIHDTNPY